ncbi:lysozyme family protein [Peribacillus deserti]|uniref:CwlT-like lysozyme domain-containing protein n=1 Tax=Peribacillus deserti TaxID=673318 RepID=A0A2N5M7W6_9BACI|nr:lysozyme family protein [Peribacillus deserti]PLT30468.1 hypothetical protein CUU66_07340 [Peribacillus deserti]
MKKRKRKSLKPLLTMMIVLLLFTGAMRVIQVTNTKTETSSYKQDPFSGVKRYSPQINNELKKYQLQNFAPVLLALMQQESKGKGGDPMQASESAGLAPNTITSPEKSIQQGVKHFEQMLAYGKQKKVDFPAIIQAYNMGQGYINYVSAHGGKHSQKLAKQFSMLQVRKNPAVYNCRGDKNNFRYPYCYGDFTYSTKVEGHLKSIQPGLTLASLNVEAAI